MLQQPGLRIAIQLQIQTLDPELELPREFVLPDPRRERGHAADLSCGLARRFRCTRSSEIAAGVIPDMREA